MQVLPSNGPGETVVTLNSPDPDPVEAEQIIAVVEMQFQGEGGLWKVSADAVEMLDGLHEVAS